MNLKNELNKIHQYIDKNDCINRTVSSKSMYWHIDHSLKVIMGITTMLKKSKPENYIWEFNMQRLVIFTKGVIPRGKGNAPKGVIATEPITQDDLRFQYEKVLSFLEDLEQLPPNSFFKHSVFGFLNRKKSIFFMALHTKHHRLIIKDIDRD